MHINTYFTDKQFIQFFVGISLFSRQISCASNNADNLNVERTQLEELRDKFNIMDFDCLFLDYKFESSLNCSFIKSVDGDADQTTSYHLRLSNVETTCECPEPFSHASLVQCIFRASEFDKFRNQYSFILRAEDENSNRTQNIAINRTECMVLERPGFELAVLNKTSNSICLQWANKRKDNHNFEIEWEFQLMPNVRHYWKVPHYAKLKETFCLTGLPYSNQEYKMTLRCRIHAARAHWSDYFNYTFRTEFNPNLPSASMKLTHSYNILIFIIVYIFH